MPRVLIVLAMLAANCACAPALHTRNRPPVPAHEFAATMQLQGSALEQLHLSMPEQSAQPADKRVLVLYASGDGGWFGSAVDMFHEIAKAGRSTPSGSARAHFSKIKYRSLGPLSSVNQLATDYREIIERARADLHLDDSVPAFLTGWSRGAAFAVLVASEPGEQQAIAGVVAIGLSEGEDLQVNGAEDETDDGSAGVEARTRPFEPYQQIARLKEPCAVIQRRTTTTCPPRARVRSLGPDGVAPLLHHRRQEPSLLRAARINSTSRCSRRSTGSLRRQRRAPPVSASPDRAALLRPSRGVRGGAVAGNDGPSARAGRQPSSGKRHR